MVWETMHEGERVALTTTPGGDVLACENEVRKVSHRLTHTVVKVVQVEEMHRADLTSSNNNSTLQCDIVKVRGGSRK